MELSSRSWRTSSDPDKHGPVSCHAADWLSYILYMLIVPPHSKHPKKYFLCHPYQKHPKRSKKNKNKRVMMKIKEMEKESHQLCICLPNRKRNNSEKSWSFHFMFSVTLVIHYRLHVSHFVEMTGNCSWNLRCYEPEDACLYFLGSHQTYWSMFLLAATSLLYCPSFQRK